MDWCQTVDNVSMSLERIQADLASQIIARFLQMRKPSPRHPLVVMVRDGSILDEMEMRSLIRAENNRADYFPTLGTFALLSDEDERLDYARIGMVRVLYTLANLYETREPSTTYTREELIGYVKDRYDNVDPDQVSLGLYLSIPEFGAIRSFGRTDDGTQIQSFTIAEQVLKIDNPEAAWLDRVALSRKNASALSSALSLGTSALPETESVDLNDQERGSETGFDKKAEPAGRHPKVFISYAWESDEHRSWVRRFATRLRADGIDASLDQWDLEPGDNRFQFMEKIASVDSVVIVCTSRYAEKSNARLDGVGYESNIITSGIAEQAGRQKFIPVLRSGTFSSSVPVWLKHANAINLSDDPFSEDEYRKLLRTLHRKKQMAPPLGAIPTFENEPEAAEPIVVRSVRTAALPARMQLSDELGIKEHELLDAAANDPSGQISHRRPIGRDILQAGDKSFLAGVDRKTEAAWMAALRALEMRGLIQPASPERHFYSVTDAGYKISAELGRFRRWKTKAVELAANYVGREPDSISIPCTGVVVLPASYYEDNVGADGGVMRSVKRDTSLWVEDIDSTLLKDLGWEANAVSFVDEETQEAKDFQIHPIASLERGSLLLEIPGGHRLKAVDPSL